MGSLKQGCVTPQRILFQKDRIFSYANFVRNFNVPPFTRGVCKDEILSKP